MPRYIDADELWLQLDKRESFEQGRNRAYYKGLRDAKKVLDDTPTADVVEVVRCKDCKFWDITSPMATVIPVPCRCGLRRDHEATLETDFCSYAVRKEEKTDES